MRGRMKIRWLICHPEEEFGNRFAFADRSGIGRQAPEFAGCEVQVDCLMADRMHRHFLATAPALGHRVMPLNHFAQRPSTQPAGNQRFRFTIVIFIHAGLSHDSRLRSSVLQQGSAPMSRTSGWPFATPPLKPAYGREQTACRAVQRQL